MAGGPDGSNFQRVAEQYQKILARSGIDLKIEPSHGSADNLAMMAEHTVDVALVQAGVTRKDGTDDIVSLGTMFRQPVMIFYRASKPLTLLSQLDGERIAVGHAGSGRSEEHTSELQALLLISYAVFCLKKQKST